MFFLLNIIFPFKAVGICVVFVFAIIFITMRYAVQKSKNQNTIEMIRKRQYIIREQKRTLITFVLFRTF